VKIARLQLPKQRLGVGHLARAASAGLSSVLKVYELMLQAKVPKNHDRLEVVPGALTRMPSGNVVVSYPYLIPGYYSKPE
jgi:hypothetical protein